MKRLKKIVVAFLAVFMVMPVFAGCGGGNNVLTIWTFTDELKKMVNDYYLKDHPEMEGKINVQVVPGEVFTSRVDQSFKTGENAPDIVALDIMNARKYLTSGALLSLSSDGLDLETRAREELYSYTVDLMKHTDDKVYGLSWQATPGGYFYRRSMALEVFGTDDPVAIQDKVKDWDAFLNTASVLKAHRGTKFSDIRVMSAQGGAVRPFLGQREHAWIENNELVIDPVMVGYLDFIKTLETNKYINETNEWQTGWYADMSANKVFGYFMPAWGLHFNLKPNADSAAKNPDGTPASSSKNDWGVVAGPATYVSGGTFLSVYNNSKHKEEAKSLLEYFMFNEGFLEAWSNDMGDLVSNKAVVNKIKEGYSEEFLGGQNHYEIFANLVEDVNISTFTGDETTIKNLFEGVATQYAGQRNGFITKEFTIAEFKKLFKNSFQAVTVN